MVFGVLLQAVMAVAASVSAQPPAPPYELSAQVDGRSSYIWRGMEVNRNPVMQLDASAAFQAFSIGIWANAPSNFSGNEIDEIDVTLSYAFDVGPIACEAGLIRYTFPSGVSTETTELMMNFSGSPWNGIELFLDLSFDVAAYRGAKYAELGMSWQHELAKDTSIEGRIGVAFADKTFNEWYFGAPIGGINGLFFEIASEIPIRSGAAIRPSITVWNITNKDVIDATSRRFLWSFGLGAGIGF